MRSGKYLKELSLSIAGQDTHPQGFLYQGGIGTCLNKEAL
jgi:hypothetical protein